MAGFDLSAFLTSMQAAASAPGGQTIAARLAPLHSLEEAKSRYLDKAVSKPDGSSRGTIIDVHSQADGSEAQEAIFLFHAKFEDQTEEFLTYDQLLANLALGSNPAPAPAPVPASTSAQPLAFDPQGSFEALLSSLIQAGGDPMQILQTLPLPSTTGDAAVDALINLYNQGQTETDEQVEGASAPSGGQKKKPAVKRNPKPPGESGPAPAKTRHRPFRYIQLPVATAHGLYGELQFPLSLTCRCVNIKPKLYSRLVLFLHL